MLSLWLLFPIVVVVIIITRTAAAAAATAADSSYFHCADPSQAIEISDFNFDTIATQCFQDNWIRSSDGGSNHVLPKRTHWHIYAIPDGEVPKYSCFPEGLVEPQISGSTLELSANMERLKELGYSKGDKIESSINVYIPLNQLRNIRVDGIDQTVEVIVTEELLTTNNDNDDNDDVFNNTTNTMNLPSIRILSSGVDTRVYVTAPYSPIVYTGSGVNNHVTIKASRNSSVDLSGVDQQVHIQSELLIGVIPMSGINNRLYLEGNYEKIQLSGVDCQVYVNGETGCNAIENSGVDNNCQIFQDNVTVPAVSCLATTTVIQGCSFWCFGSDEGGSVGTAVGMGIGLLVFLALMIGCCVFLCRGRYTKKKTTHHYSSSQTSPYKSESNKPQEATYVEAEVIAIEETTTMTVDPESAPSSSISNTKHILTRVG